MDSQGWIHVTTHTGLQVKNGGKKEGKRENRGESLIYNTNILFLSFFFLLLIGEDSCLLHTTTLIKGGEKGR